MNPIKRINTLLAIALLAICASCAGTAQAPIAATDQPEISEAPSDAQPEQVPQEAPQSPAAEPAPEPATADVLQLESITFTPDASPMPDAQTYMDAAVQGDAAAQFILQMMYRDKIGNIVYWDNHNKKSDILSDEDIHREMIRWRDISVESGNELALLSADPSIIYELSPLFSADDTFNTELNWLHEAAKRGFGNAEYILGLVYWDGIGVDKNQAKGYELLVRAAAHDVGNASYAIAMIHELNLLSDPSISRDTANKSKEKRSFFWLRKAFLQNNEDARFILTMKHADKIGIPADENQTTEDTEATRVYSESGTYHLWMKLHDYYQNQFENMICKFEYDKGEIGQLYYYSECEGEKFEINEEDEEVIYSVEDAAENSLDYKIDYKLAGKWLQTYASDLANINVRILRAQTRAITGCRGNLNQEKPFNPEVFKKIKDYEEDGGTLLPDLLNAIIAMEADEPAMTADQVLDWYKDAANKGNINALKFLGDLFNHNKKHDNDAYSDYCKLWNISYDSEKSYDYYSRGNLYYEAEKVAENAIEEAQEDNDAQSLEKWKDKLYEIRERDYIDKMNTHEYNQAGNIASVIREDAQRDNDAARAHTWALKYIEAHEKQSDAFIAETDKARSYRYANAKAQARLIAQMAKKIEDDERAIEWYKKAIAMQLQLDSTLYSGDKEEFYYELGLIYDSGSEKVQNKSTALEYYKKVMVKWNGKMWTYSADTINRETKMADLALRIGKIYEDGTDSVAPDINFAMEWYKRANEICSYADRSHKLPCNQDVTKQLLPIKKQIESLPKIDLLNEVEKQIKAEHGKKPGSFFVIKKVLNPCLKRIPQNYSSKDLKNQCTDIPQFFEESIQKAMMAIIALNLAGGTYDEDTIANTFYFLAVYKGNDTEYRKTLRTFSPVYDKLITGLPLSTYYDNEMFNIWYLRQIPYAAEEKYKTMNAADPWQYYMDRAKEMMAQNEQLNKAFGFGYPPESSGTYAPPKPMQQFRDKTTHPEWFTFDVNILFKGFKESLPQIP